MYGKLRECKTVDELCSVFNELSYIPTEHSLVCSTCVLHPFRIGANIPGRFLYDVANDETYKSTHTMSREFRNLKVHIKTHFENELHMDNVHEREGCVMQCTRMVNRSEVLSCVKRGRYG